MDDGASRADAAEQFFLLPDHGGMPFASAIAALHRHLEPQSCLELGTLAGETLRLANCPAIAVGPRFACEEDMLGSKPACVFMQMPSDRFFAAHDPAALLNRPLDLALLDGGHRFELLLRDFINTERHCNRGSIIVLRGCLPTDSHVARREQAECRFARLSPHPQLWAGDVWKTLVILGANRPDLRVLAFNAAPAGLVAVTNLDPRSDLLAKRYFGLAEQFRAARLTQAGAEALMRSLNVRATEVFDDPDALAALFGRPRRAPAKAAPRAMGPSQTAGRDHQPEPQSEPPIALHEFSEPGGPVRGLEDIWTRLHPLLTHWRRFNEEEERIRNQQQGMVRDGCFLMPSPFGDSPDLCTTSYYVPHRFCYHFRASEEYFWISSTLDNAFALSAIFFPARRIAVHFADAQLGEDDLRQLEGTRAAASKPDAAAPARDRPIVVTGHPHYVHTLWNELPALDQAASAGLGDALDVAAVYQPLGPLAELFPEFARGLRAIKFDAVPALNGERRLLVGLGSRTITPRVQERLRAVAARLAGAAALAERDGFAARIRRSSGSPRRGRDEPACARRRSWRG